MNICHFFKNYLLIKLEELHPDLPKELLTRITVEPTKNPDHGDLSTNAAMILAKVLKTTPLTLAETIIPLLKMNPHVANAEKAGGGFINLTLFKEFWQKQLGDALSQRELYGNSSIGQGRAINIEFVSVNPTGPLHTGHGRNAVLGDTIASLLKKAGFNVTKEYYINDAGGQITALARSVYLRYKEALGSSISDNDFSDDMYRGEYLIPVAHHLITIYGEKFLNSSESEWLEIFRTEAVSLMMTNIKDDLDLLGVQMDIYTSEKDIIRSGRLEEALSLLKSLGHIYNGILTPPKGISVDDWEPQPQTIFRSTDFGDDTDRVIKKSDGSWTYFAGDLAYHLDKFQRGFSMMIDVFGADHAGYVKRILASVKALTEDKANLTVKVCQMVNFLDNGTPVRMSKRAGTFITVRDVVERVGKEATRFMMVSRHQDMMVDFDFTKVVEATKDNPIFYIQYAHARIHSVLRHARTTFPKEQDGNVNLLNHQDEILLIQKISDWPRQIELAATTQEPHRIANYLYDLAGMFHAHWNKGKDHFELRFIDPKSQETTEARLALLRGVAMILTQGLHLLGIEPVEEMH